MRASRLLQMLLLLQNRGRMTSTTLARELEVTPRTILRDVDALTEAGLPMVVYPGHRGGIELGFEYRTRLTGLAADEAEAAGVLLSLPVERLSELGLGDAANRARRKLLESLPDHVRERAYTAARRFRVEADPSALDVDRDARLAALSNAVRHHRIVRIQAHSALERTVHPVALVFRTGIWFVQDDLVPGHLTPLDDCGDINVSARTFRPRTKSPEDLCTVGARPSL
ncbi:MAG: HTH domain-containing protein [Vicinamibacterales bacterium]